MSSDNKLLILHTPASLDGEHPAGAELEGLGASSRGGGRLGPELIAELRAGTWLGAGEWRRGAYFTTSGLREGAGHPSWPC